MGYIYIFGLKWKINCRKSYYIYIYIITIFRKKNALKIIIFLLKVKILLFKVNWCQEIKYDLFIVIATIIILYTTEKYVCYLYHQL